MNISQDGLSEISPAYDDINSFIGIVTVSFNEIRLNRFALKAPYLNEAVAAIEKYLFDNYDVIIEKLAGGISFTGEPVHIDKFGFASITISPFEFEGGSNGALIMISETNPIVNQQEMKNMMSAYEYQTRESISAFFTSLSLIEQQFGGNRNIMKHVGSAELQGLKLLRLSNHLSAYRQIVDGTFRINTSCVSLVNILNSLADACNDLCKSRGISVKISAPKKDIYTFLDVEKFSTAILNIITNAYASSPDKSVISITASENANNVIISVSDSGDGFSKEKMATIFEPFVNSDPSEMQNGLGIGLYLARHIIALHGGMIAALKSANGDTSVNIILPLCDTKEIEILETDSVSYDKNRFSTEFIELSPITDYDYFDRKR